MIKAPAYPRGDVVGPCVCGSWPGGKCFKCKIIVPTARQLFDFRPVTLIIEGYPDSAAQ
jgi:hypothetical protein